MDTKKQTEAMKQLQFEIPKVRQAYSSALAHLPPEQSGVIAHACVVVAGFYQGEIVRLKHEIRDFMLGFDYVHRESAGQDTCELLWQSIKTIPQEPLAEDTVKNISQMTKHLEGMIYDGQ